VRTIVTPSCIHVFHVLVSFTGMRFEIHYSPQKHLMKGYLPAQMRLSNPVWRFRSRFFCIDSQSFRCKEMQSCCIPSCLGLSQEFSMMSKFSSRNQMHRSRHIMATYHLVPQTSKAKPPLILNQEWRQRFNLHSEE